MWSILLFPQEFETTSKTGAQDESLLNDAPKYRFCDRVVKAWKAIRSLADPVARIPYLELCREFRHTGQQVGMQVLDDPSLEQLHHGAISTDVSHKTRILDAAIGPWLGPTPESARQLAMLGPPAACETSRK